MRIWSIHPKYLDRQGLVALWRETLLAQKVLAGKTKGYRHHPQLIRFRETKDPLAYIGSYLHLIHLEAKERGYRFDVLKILKLLPKKHSLIQVTSGQLKYESEHLRKKLMIRDPERLKMLPSRTALPSHPLFEKKPGAIEAWEKR